MALSRLPCVLCGFSASHRAVPGVLVNEMIESAAAVVARIIRLTVCL